MGKSVIFGFLTGRYVTVSNYPGTTVTVTKGKTEIDGESLDVIDTPGVNSLTPMSEDERVTRDILLEAPPRAVVQVADAKNLRRALQISAQLSEPSTRRSGKRTRPNTLRAGKRRTRHAAARS